MSVVSSAIPELLPSSVGRKAGRPTRTLSGSTTGTGCSAGGSVEENQKWLLSAVRRIREQKQKSNLARITKQLSLLCPGRFSDVESISDKLEEAVEAGALLRYGPAHTADCSYQDPGRVIKLHTHKLAVSKGADLSKPVMKAIRNLADVEGSTVADIAKYVRTSFVVRQLDKTSLEDVLANSCQMAVEMKKMSCIRVNDVDRFQILSPEKPAAASKPNKLSSSFSSSSNFPARVELHDKAFTSSDVCNYSSVF